MELLKEAKIIEEKEHLVMVERIQTAKGTAIQLSCEGQNKWSKDLRSSMGDVILHDFFLYNLPGEQFMVAISAEHSRGATFLMEHFLFNTLGEEIWSHADNLYTKVALDGKYIWLLKNKELKQSGTLGKNPSRMLIKVDHRQGRIAKRIDLNFEQLTHLSQPIVLNTKLINREDTVFLSIGYSDRINPSKKLRTRNIRLDSL